MTNAARRSAAGLIERIATRRPLSAGSLIVTVFGDAIRPHGGVLSLAALTRVMDALAIKPGQIRTALSRLSADGWFERSRDGRASFYELATARVAEFDAAGQRIYQSRKIASGDRLEFDQLMLTGGTSEERADFRARMAPHGFGALTPTVLLRPSIGGNIPEVPRFAHALGRLDLTGSSEAALRALARETWPIDELGRLYATLVEDLATIDPDTIASDDLASFVVRILAVHEYRRVALRDPLLPAPLLPHPWPGDVAHAQLASLYRALWQPSERWLRKVAAECGDELRGATHDGAMRFG